MNRLLEQVRLRNKVGVENRDELTRGLMQTVFQRTSLVAHAVGTVNVMHLKTARAQLGGLAGHDVRRFIRRIIKHLHFDLILRIIEGGDRLKQPLGDIHLVVQGQLDGDLGKLSEVTHRLRHLSTMAKVQKNHPIPVDAITRQAHQNRKIDYRSNQMKRLHSLLKLCPAAATAILGTPGGAPPKITLDRSSFGEPSSLAVIMSERDTESSPKTNV